MTTFRFDPMNLNLFSRKFRKSRSQYQKIVEKGGKSKISSFFFVEVVLDVFDYLKWRVSVCLQAGILPENLIIDPGIGFGKNDDHNISILTRISLLHSLGFPILLGMSRKSLIASLSDGEPADKRLPGSLAAALYAAGQGVQLLRVHDVSETRQALDIKEALQCSF